jgi:molybdenum cofactor cytidylyltransferase
MKFGAVAVKDAKGAILAHSVGLDRGRLRKGLLLEADHLDQLRAAGVLEVVVARLEPSDIHEDEAAARMAQALAAEADGVRIGPAGTGRVNLFSDVNGIAQVDADKINAANLIDPMITIATVPQWQRMSVGDMVATVKIISYGVDGEALDKACEAAASAISMRVAQYQTASLIQTQIAGGDGDKGHKAIGARLEALGVALGPKILCAHEIAPLADALRNATGEVIFILTSSATSDINDTAPQALRAAGGEVSHFGMPVDPGNLLFLGALGGKPVVGLPGCARSPALNGADWVLERVLCGLKVTPEDIMAMGVGGLLKEIPTRPQPRRG